MKTGTNKAASGSGGQPFDLIPAKVGKPWHQFITPDLRHDKVKRMVKSLVSIRDPHSIIDKRKHNISAYARKIEGEMYGKASSISQYFHLLDNKMDWIRLRIAVANSKPSAG